MLKRLWIALLAAVLLIGCGKPASNELPAETDAPKETIDPYVKRAETMLAEMDTRSMLEQLLVLAIQTYDGQPFLAVNDDVRTFLNEHAPGGMILFTSNSESPEQTARLTSDLQAAVKENGGTGMLMAMDQEGGALTRLAMGTITPGNMALGASGKPSLAKASAGILGGELAAVGINTDFAPDADVNNEPKNPIIGIRSFSDDPLLTSKMTAAYIEGLQESEVIACAKHFPGHGNTVTDSHTGLPVVNSTLEELEAMELIPFHGAVEAGTDMIMSAHICFPNIETETYVSKLDGSEIVLPATLSPALLKGVLREDLGYDGVVITDSLLMDAIRSHFDPIDAAVLALNAGADMLLMPVLIENRDGLEEVDTYLDALEARIGTDVTEERLKEAVTRILAMKAEHGILDGLTDTETAVASSANVGRIENAESERAIADQCVTVVTNNEDVLPLRGAGKVVLAAPQGSQVNALQYGYEQLIATINLVYRPVYVNYSYGRDIAAVENEIPGADAVVIVSWLDNMSQFDPAESIMIPSVQQIIASCRAQNVPVIVISSGLPYDLSCYEDADALVAAFNPAGLRKDDAGNEISKCGPNIPAALDIIFDYAHPSGTLPVNVPKVEGTSFTDEIAYPRGTGLTW